MKKPCLFVSTRSGGDDRTIESRPVFGNHSCLFRLFNVFDFMGATFPNLTAFTKSVMKRFVLGEKTS